METANYSAPGGPDEGDDMGMEIPAPKSEEKAAKTALVPTEFFGGKELAVGTECKVKVDRILDGQVQVSYVQHEEGPELGEEPDDDEEMSQYMNE